MEQLVDEIFSEMQASEGRIKVDIDSLQALTVQLVHATRHPQFIADYCMIKNLVSPKVRLSARFIYLETVKAGIDWLVEQAKAGMRGQSDYQVTYQSIHEQQSSDDQFGMARTSQKRLVPPPEAADVTGARE